MTLRKSIAAIVSLLALVVCASPASADPLSMTFTDARANVGKQLSDAALFGAAGIAPFSAQIDPATGAISNGTLSVPDFETHIEEPIQADVTVDFDIGQITGSFDQTSGALSLTGEAAGTLTATNNPTWDGEECTVLAKESPITLETAGSSGGSANPRTGTPFTSGLTGPGAIAGEWEDMSATPVEPGNSKNLNFCNNVENRIGGPGGIWLLASQLLIPDVFDPAAPQLTSTDPSSPSLSGTPRVRGVSESGTTVHIYAGSNCGHPGLPYDASTPLAPGDTPVATGSAGELASPGITVQVAEGTTATFSATATDAAGHTSSCSASISYTRAHLDPAVTCTVPKLAGMKLGRAKTALREAHCSVGKVFKPKHTKGKRRSGLVVKSSTPPEGTSLTAGSAVNLKVGHKHRKPRRR
jgi:PASTA domain